jgi:two-component system, OmpR family, sensor histidine kinase BaeS
MSLRWHIFSAFLIISLLTIFISVYTGYTNVQDQLEQFVVTLSYEKADLLSGKLGVNYKQNEGWSGIKDLLESEGYGEKRYIRENREDGEDSTFSLFSREAREENEEREHTDRVVLTDLQNKVLYDNYGLLRRNSVLEEPKGQLSEIINPETSKRIGKVYVNVNQEFLSPESNNFLSDILKTSAIWGLLTASVSLLLSAWLSRRITRPVEALTLATKNIVEGVDMLPFPVTTSDELGKLSASFNDMSGALNRQKDLRQRLIHDLSHELNTPLSIINLEAEGLKDGMQSAEEAAEHIIMEIERLKNLVQDLNWLAESDFGELQFTFTDDSLDKLISEEVYRWQPKALAGGIRLLLTNQPDKNLRKIDALRFRQALGIFINNALQHTPEEGSIEVQVCFKDGFVLIKIIDDGSGIAAVDLPFLFDRFYRGENSKNEDVAGRGLGLTIAKTIINAHNGTIEILSEGENKGTCVLIQCEF